MENFVAILIFTLPGILSYFWIQLFGLHPASKHINFEIAAISAILWFPVGMIVLGIYQLIVVIVNANPVNNPWLSVHMAQLSKTPLSFLRHVQNKLNH
ncbi:hypothetical protein [Bacillus swezeyi]|uniref:hypothetical protein n=1 Tax=Bacillus swezeyi TaxID=1925020 RepID=UPI003F89A42F